MQHLAIASPHELLDATFRERRRRGWAAVAPELEPYVNKQRWPSGLFLPEDLRNHAARRIRHPPWFPQWGFAVLMIAVGAWCHIICMAIATDVNVDDITVSPGACGTEDDPNIACQPCVLATACVISMVTLVVYGILRINKQVQEHVNALYVFYALDLADPSMPPDLMCDITLSRGFGKLQPMRVTVFADGTFDVVPNSLLGPRRDAGDAAAASSDTRAFGQHACECRHCQCKCQQLSSIAPQKANPGGAVEMKLRGGKLPSSSGRKLPASSEGEKDRLLGDSAV